MLEFVSQLKEVSRSKLEAMAAEIDAAPIVWGENYSKYHSSGWKTVALLNVDGDPNRNDLEDCTPVETEILKVLPHTREFIRSLGLRFMWARLLKMEPQTYLWEHTDYGDLKDEARLRLHIPIKTNESALMVFPEVNVHLSAGFIWKLDPKIVRHAAFNAGSEPRIHMIIDCYVDDRLQGLIDQETLPPQAVLAKPDFDEEARAKLVSAAGELLDSGQVEAAERSLLKAFHHYSFPESSSFEALIRFYSERGNPDRAAYWESERMAFLNLSVEAKAA